MAEGKVTEVEYVQRLNQILRGAVVEVHGAGADPGRVLGEVQKYMKKAAKKGQPFDWACCVVDVDQHQTLEKALRDADRSGIIMIVTNLKFEQWLLWHVDDRGRANGSKELDGLMTAKGLMEGKSLSPAFPMTSYPAAVKNAKRADPAMQSCRKGRWPSSAMPLLIELMEGKGAHHNPRCS